MDQIHIYIMYVLLTVGVTFGSSSLYLDDKHQWMLNIARYVVYVLTIQGARVLCTMCYDILHKKFKPEQLKKTNWLLIIIYIASIGILMSNNQWFYAEDFPLIFIAYLIVEYPEMVTDGDCICQECMNLLLTELNNRNEHIIGDRQLGHQSVCVWCGISISRRTGRRSRPLMDDHPEWGYVAGIISPRQMDKTESFIKYGLGMACSFYEGYLMIVIPSDGGKFGGFIQNIEAFESREGVVVPVKKLFIVITKSLYSPPDLQLFNKTNRDDLPILEACSEPIPCEAADDDLLQSLDDLEKDIAGVKNRSYKNCAYRIYRPSGLPVSLIAECATPLHTLYKVIENTELYGDLGEVNVEEVCDDFCTTLKNILARSSECRDRVELVYYDDTDPESNLADVLLDRIRQLEPNFEELISVRR